MFTAKDLREKIKQNQEKINTRFESALDYVKKCLDDSFHNDDFEINNMSQSVIFKFKVDFSLLKQGPDLASDIVNFKDEITHRLAAEIGCAGIEMRCQTLNENKIPGIKAYVIVTIEIYPDEPELG